MNREVQVRICERLGVKFPGPIRPTRNGRLPGRYCVADIGGRARHVLDADARKRLRRRPSPSISVEDRDLSLASGEQSPGYDAGAWVRPHATASLAALTGRALMILRAGFALKTVGSFVNGLIPRRAFVAGFFMTMNLASPGITNAPVFLSSLWPISATASTTPLTSLRAISFGCPSTIR